jgi:hypothetical protein
MLGPLCVATSIVAIASADPSDGPPDLWSRLDSVVCTTPRDARRRIAVADSKRLKGSNQAKAHPLRHLERGVLSFLACADTADHEAGDTPDRGHAPPATDHDLFTRLGTGLPTAVSTPWYRSTTSLPVAHDADALALDAARLHRGLDAAGVRVLGLRAEAVDAGEFNRRLTAGTGKAGINLDAAVRLVAAIRDAVRAVDPEAVPRIVCDRQGGRAYYREWLQDCFPEASIRILGETDTVSRYRLDSPDGGFVIGFETGSEDRHLPVALASMTAKYLRELAMVRLNRFFRDALPEVKPTAGYVQDGRRFLHEIRPVIESRRLQPAELVRNA